VTAAAYSPANSTAGGVGNAGNTGNAARDVRLVVPAYFHPQDDPEGWRRLAALGPRLAAAIMNPDSGPGAAVDERYHAPVDAVLKAGGRVIGYVDTGYGQRAPDDVLRDVAAYRDWYGLTGVFLDQAASAPGQLGYYRQLAEASRAAGTRFVALNPGVIPASGYAEVADLLVTFEGPWAAYRGHRAAAWMLDRPAELFGNLVHGAPPGALESAAREAPARHAGAVYATELTGANPWAQLCGALLVRA
jgi:hypothetical protein